MKDSKLHRKSFMDLSYLFEMRTYRCIGLQTRRRRLTNCEPIACHEIENGSDSPSLSFSCDLSQTEMISPEKLKIEGSASTEFEFCIVSNVNDSRVAKSGETMLAADELFVDGKIQPLFTGLEAQPITIASLGSSTCSSSVRSAASTSSESENAPHKSDPKPYGKWKTMFKLGNVDFFCAMPKETDREAKEERIMVKAAPSASFECLFSRRGRRKRRSAFFCSIPFSRSNSLEERRSKPENAAFQSRRKSVGDDPDSKETETLVAGSKPVEAAVLKPENFKLVRKVPVLSNLKGSPQMVLRSREGAGNPSRNFASAAGSRPSGRFVVRNLERRSRKGIDSPRPGKPMSDGLLKTKNNSGAGTSMRANSVRQSVGIGIGIGMEHQHQHVGGRNGPGLFRFRTAYRAFFAKQDNSSLSV